MTINWTIATENGGKNFSQVHKNEYDMTLAELIEWIRDTEEVAENIINIEPLKKSCAAMPKTYE